jgi:periplasmic protein TonB
VFEQSLLLNPHANKPWNFLASLGAELLIVSVALLIPLASSGHLPVFRWNNVVMRPAPAPLPIERVVSAGSVATNTFTVAARPVFHLDPTARIQPAQNLSSGFTADAPPTIGLVSSEVGPGPSGGIVIVPPALPPPPKPAATSSGPIKVGGSVQMAKLIHKVIPLYPALARTARIAGVVHLIGTIGKDGTIRNLQLVGGHPMLARAALEAVQQWVYEPTLLNGEPVEVIAPIEVSFTLGQ